MCSGVDDGTDLTKVAGVGPPTPRKVKAVAGVSRAADRDVPDVAEYVRFGPKTSMQPNSTRRPLC